VRIQLPETQGLNRLKMAKILIIGAGVVGLTTALELKRDNADHQITVAAQHIPGDISLEYTSPFAGANWHSFATKEDTRLQDFDKLTYSRLIELAETDANAGIWILPDVSYFTAHELKNQSYDELIPWFSGFVDDFKILEESELPQGIVFGFKFKGVVISVPIYLNYLYAKNIALGNIVKRVKKIESVDEARNLHSETKADLVINCSGLLSSQLLGYTDSAASYPVRGQTLLVRNNASKTSAVSGFQGYDDEMLYIMPRKEGGSIIGGCFLVNNDDGNEDPELTERICQRAVKYAPELVDAKFKNNPTLMDIVKVNVGLRPFRNGGIRIERDPQKPWLIHNYGAGAGGYQGSYGFSKRVTQIVNHLPSKF